MTTLLIAEHDGASLKDATNKALTAASALGGDVHVLVAGQNAKAAAEAASKLAGVKKVLLAEGEAYAHDLAEPLAALIVSLASSYDAVVAPATSRFKNVMPRVAALLDVMQVSEIIKVIAPDTFERPIYAGNAIQTVKLKGPAIVTTDLRLNEPRYASLPNIMKAKKKPIAEKNAADYGVDLSPRLEILKTAEPPGRKAGVKVKDVAELVSKLKNEAGVL